MFSIGNLLLNVWVWIAFFLDFLFGNNWNPSVANVEPVVMSATRLRQYQTALVFAAEVFFLDPQALDPKYDPDHTTVYEDSNDRAIVTFKDETCYAAFQGAKTLGIENVLADASQSWGLIGSQKVCGSAGCCRLDRGLSWAYYSDFVDEFEAKLRSCASQCAGGCDVVLTGHSQGAAIAQVAAVSLADLNPLLFAFGSQKVIHPLYTCDVLNSMETFYRTQSLCEDNGQPAYDGHVYMGVFWGKHTGTLIVVGQGGAATMGRNKDVFLAPFLNKCHDVYRYYIGPVMKLTADVPFDGYTPGSMCSRQMECKSRSCVDRRCL